MEVGDQISSGRRSVGSRTPDRGAARVTPEFHGAGSAFCRSPADLYGIDDTRPSLDDYPSYGGTPTRGALTPRGTPFSDGEGGGGGAARKSVSIIMKGLGLSSGRKSGRLSDADELQAQFDEIRRSNASPLRIPFTLGAGPAHIPEGDMMIAYSDVDGGRGAAAAMEMDHFEATNGGADTSYINPNTNTNELTVDMQEIQASKDEGPPERIYLQFTEVRYKVVVREAVKWRGKPRVEKEILHGITGSVGAGEMLAMMGPSGSGKTTLLNVLGGRRINPQQVSGSILYNDVPYSKNLKRRIGFVTQDDVLFPHLTVKETLTFSALLRLPSKLSREQKVERAESVIAQLGLQKCKDTIIGNQFLRGVSGGERKRVCIGQEILTNPSILFLDEPTSGLDSTTALRIIRLLQNIAHQGRSVMATIHQPSSRAFHMFDKLILLSDGHSTYFGKARGAMTYFDSIGFTPMIPMNPADFLLDLCSGNTSDMSVPPSLRYPPPMKKNTQGGANIRKPNGASTDLTISSVQGTPTTLLAKDVKKYLVECCEQHMSSLDRTKSFENHKMQHGINPNATTEKREWSTTWWEQFIILFIRGFKERRHEYLSWMRVIQVVLSSLLAGCLWWHSKHNTPMELQDQEGLLFFIGVFWGYFPLFTAIFTFPMERPILAKERATDMYRLSAYFMARTLSDLPIELGLCIAFISILYFMASLRCTITAFIYTILSVCLDVVTSQGVGFFIGAALMDVQKATTFASVFVLAFMLAGGYFVQKIPPFIGWIKYISFQAHTYEILRDVQYGHLGIMKHILAMVVMVFGYRIMAYIALRRMKVGA